MTMRHYGVIVAVATVPAIVLSAGCGAKSKQDTPYRGTYRAAYTIPALNETGTFSFTVEQKGDMTGSMVDNNTGKVYAFNGSVAPSGYFSGTLVNGGDRFKFEGTLAVNGATSGGGDFKQTRASQEVRGSFSLTDNAITPTPGSSFRGAYSGSYNIPGLSQTGVTSFSVNSRGDITGSFARNDETGLLSGTVQETGAFVGTVQFTSETLNLTGTLNKTSDGSTSGNFLLAQSGKSFPGTFGPTQTAPAGDSPYQGAYRGTYGVPEMQESGNLSFTVDPRGKLIGFFSQSSNKPVGTFTASINNDGTFAGQVTYDPTTNIAARPITGKLGNSNVNSRRAGDFVWTINGKSVPGNCEVGVGASEVDTIYRGSYAGPTINDAVYFINAGGTPLSPVPLQRQDADNLSFDQTTGNVNGSLGTVAAASLTIDKQGHVVGTLGGFALDVTLTNDGRIFGTLAGFPVRGAVSRQQIQELQSYSSDPVTEDIFETVTNPDGSTSQQKIGTRVIGYKVKYEYADEPGIAGDFIVTVNGREINGSLQLIGGNAEGATPR